MAYLKYLNFNSISLTFGHGYDLHFNGIFKVMKSLKNIT